MYPIRAERSFSSSPPSSPSLRTIDSSPLSSPEPEVIPEPILVNPPAHIPHPLAASVKANRAPPQHEWKTSQSFFTYPISSPVEPSFEPPTKRYRVSMPALEEDESVNYKDSSLFSEIPEDREMD